MMEEKSVLAWLLRYFEVESVLRRDQVRAKGELILRPLNGMQIRLRARRPINV